MLQELSIRNFAIIDDLHISFSDGLTILSGETGTGKSVITNAVNLLLGSRASAKLIRTGAETAELEALFQFAKESKAAQIMEKQGFDTLDGLLVRRIISRKDRHRIYINGRLATIHMLNLITENLASISSQHSQQRLLKEDQHLLILDQFGGLMPQRKEVCKCFHEILPLIRKLKVLESDISRRSDYINTLRFEKKEIQDASIIPGEDAALEQERTRLKNGKLLYQIACNSVSELYSSRGAILERLIEIRKDLDKGCRIDPELISKRDSLAESAFQIEDTARELESYIKIIQMDENRLDEIETRINLLNKLKRKYGGSIEEVISHLESIDDELTENENISEKTVEIESKISDLYKRLKNLVKELSQKRKQASEILSKKIEKELRSLKMPHTRFQIELQPIAAGGDANLTIDKNVILETGIDKASFLIAPNAGEELKPLADIASGGELSRVVLALKASLLAETDSVSTIVFDEVDAGIGGSAAEIIGKKISCLAGYHQVICITHLPQIAKFGRHHYRISKHVSGGRTHTSINLLDEKDRVKEIARMLGGLTITQAALDHAREMLQDG